MRFFGVGHWRIASTLDFDMEMEGMMVLLEEGVGGVVGVEEVQVKFGVVGL